MADRSHKDHIKGILPYTSSAGLGYTIEIKQDIHSRKIIRLTGSYESERCGLKNQFIFSQKICTRFGSFCTVS